MKKNKIRFLFVLIIGLMTGSCVNPFGKGTWTPLPFKKMQKNKAVNSSPSDSTMINHN